jgi:jacalin-like lectin domain-containing protein
VGEEENMPLFYWGTSGGLGGYGEDFKQRLPELQPGISALEDCFVSRIDVWHGLFIDRIGFAYEGKNDPNITFEVAMGGVGGENKPTFHLGRDEIILAMRGRHGLFVDSLTIETMNVNDPTWATKELGPFGGSGGTSTYEYRVPLPPSPAPGTPQADMAIKGLWGGAGLFVDAIGVIVGRPYP